MPRSFVSPAAIRIRRARDADLAALVELEGGAFASDRMSARQFRHHLRNPAAEIIVAARDGGVIAAAVLLFHARRRSARLYSIAVAAHARGAGVGEAVLAATERAARARGADTLRLEVRTDNAAAQRLYDRRGYRRFGTIADYYEDGCGALRYEMPLTRSSRVGRGGGRLSPSRPSATSPSSRRPPSPSPRRRGR